MGSESLYRSLQQHLDRMPIGFPATASGVEIRILERLFTLKEAEIALGLSAMPEPARVIHNRLKAPGTLEELRSALDEMERKGLILRLSGPGEPRYGKLIFAIGVYERQLPRMTPEFERDVRQYMEEAFHSAFHSTRTTQMRIVPVNRSVSVERSVATYDDIRGHIEKSAGPFAKAPCICRHGKDLLGEPCKQTDLRENCLTIGMAARWMADSGAGRTISRQEMLDLIDEADRQGLVLQPQNTRDPIFICCCCHCCCGVLTSARFFPRPADYFSSTYFAAVDPDACQSCGTCLSRCQMDAIRMDSGPAEVDLSRCIGCALCVTTCPSGAMRLRRRPRRESRPEETRALYMQILQERYGPWGMMKIGARKLLGLKI